MVYDKSWLHQVWKRFRHGTISKRPARHASIRLYLKNAVRTRSERLVSWLKNQQYQHYGRTARIPDLFQRRDLPFFALKSGQLRIKVSPPPKHHNLLDAAANVGVLEARLNYTFKNRMNCIEALKISGVSFPLYYDGTVYAIGGNRRLALLGDRVLSLALCEIWFQTAHSNREHFLMSKETVSRAALAITGGAIGLKQSILAPYEKDPRDWNNRIAETFEAVLGAVYVDSNYDVNAVKAIISKLKLDDHRFLKTRAEVDTARTRAGKSLGSTAVFNAYRTCLSKLSQKKARAEREVDEAKKSLGTTQGELLKRTQEKGVASKGLQQEARKIPVTKAHKVAHERDGENGEDSFKTHTDLRKQDNDKSKDSTEPRKARIQQLSTPATGESQGAKQALQKAPKETTKQKTRKASETEMRKKVDLDMNAQIAAQEQDRAKDIREEIALGSLVGNIFEFPYTEELCITNAPSSRSSTDEKNVEQLEQAILDSHMVAWQRPLPEAPSDLDPKSGCFTGIINRDVDFVRPTTDIVRKREIEEAKEDFAESSMDLLFGGFMQDDGLKAMTAPTNGGLGKDHARSNVHEVSKSREQSPLPVGQLRSASYRLEDIANHNTLEIIYISALVKSRISFATDSGTKPTRTASQNSTVDENSGYSLPLLKLMTQLRLSRLHQLVLRAITRVAMSKGIRFDSTAWKDLVQNAFERLEKEPEIKTMKSKKMRSVIRRALHGRQREAEQSLQVTQETTPETQSRVAKLDVEHKGGMKELEHKPELTQSSAKVDAGQHSRNNGDPDQQEQPRYRLLRQVNGRYQPVSDSLPEDKPTEQVSTERYEVKDDEGLALYLATLPEAKTNSEAKGELPTNEEMAAISQQVWQLAEGHEGEEVTATTVDAVPSVTDINLDELRWSVSRRRRRKTRTRPGPNKPEDVSRKFTSFRPLPAWNATVAPTGVVPELAEARHEQSRENIV